MNIQIRDVPESVHRELRARAARAGLSLSAYLRAELAELAGRPSLEEWLALATHPRSRAPGFSAAEALRVERDAR